MTTFSRSRLALQLSLGLGFIAAAMLCQAQTPSRSVRSVPQPQAPVLAKGAVGPAAPNPAGLPSPLPNPAGLTSQFPAGLASPSPNPAGLSNTPAVPTVPVPILPSGPGGNPTAGGYVPPTSTMGAAGYGVPAGPQYPGAGPAPGPYTAVQVAQSFLGADANRDGELTRTEARRLTIMPSSFEEMDRNHDGILTRFEYEDAVR